jgi:hypothetical protein
MWNEQGQMATTKPADLVAALFFDEMSARDAIADLKLAGISARQIGVALSKQGKLEQTSGVPCDLNGKHSIWWKFRHSFEHDLHSQGADLSTAKAEAASSAEWKPYTEVDLSETLQQVGVAPATINLLDREIGANGMLIMVDAGDRCDEVESILERNRGMSRTVMATEQAKITS